MILFMTLLSACQKDKYSNSVKRINAETEITPEKLKWLMDPRKTGQSIKEACELSFDLNL